MKDSRNWLLFQCFCARCFPFEDFSWENRNYENILACWTEFRSLVFWKNWLDGRKSAKVDTGTGKNDQCAGNETLGRSSAHSSFNWSQGPSSPQLKGNKRRFGETQTDSLFVKDLSGNARYQKHYLTGLGCLFCSRLFSKKEADEHLHFITSVLWAWLITFLKHLLSNLFWKELSHSWRKTF